MEASSQSLSFWSDIYISIFPSLNLHFSLYAVPSFDISEPPSWIFIPNFILLYIHISRLYDGPLDYIHTFSTDLYSRPYTSSRSWRRFYLLFFHIASTGSRRSEHIYLIFFTAITDANDANYWFASSSVAYTSDPIFLLVFLDYILSLCYWSRKTSCIWVFIVTFDAKSTAWFAR